MKFPPSKNGILCYFDGCCEPRNPGGNIGMGAVIFKDGDTVETYSAFEPAHHSNSNNVAEYKSFMWILNTLLRLGWEAKEVNVYGDSNLVVQQMMGQWKIKNGMYAVWAKQAWELRCKFGNIKIHWIPRENNSFADDLSKSQLVKNNVEFKIQPNG